MTVLRAIEIQVGRTGALTPVAVLDPVDIGAASIGELRSTTLISMHSGKAQDGARVTVERAA